jgi:DNA-binding NtrC family response regulator
MPGIGGLDVLKRIRRRHPEIQVILLTGHGSTKDGIKGMRQGAFDYLMKPVNIEELIHRMSEALETSKPKTP